MIKNQASHGEAYAVFDPHRGKTLVRVTCAGEERDTLELSGKPGEALAKARQHYATLERCGALDPGPWKLTVKGVRGAKGQSVELTVPERQDAGAVKALPARKGLRPRLRARRTAARPLAGIGGAV